jgi:HlyD family secretion protein
MTARSVLACALALAVVACQKERAAAPKTAAVTRGPISEVVSATGEVSALVTVNVGSQISGTIAKLHADFNTLVKHGQILAELDPRLFEAALERANAGLAAARADEKRAEVTLADARRTEERAAKLFAKSLVAAADVDAATAAREGAEAGVLAAKARIAQARADADAAATNVALCKIRSPIDGIVISRAVDVGQTVASSLQSPTLFVIANDLARMQILAAVDEADVGKVKDGMTARFSVDAYPGEVFEGRIREVRQAPTNVQNVVTYAAVIEAPNADRKLRQGMTASVSIVTKARDSALRLSNAALRYRPPADREGADAPKLAGAGFAKAEAAEKPRATGRPGVRQLDVYKLEKGEIVRASILVGISDGHQSEVVAGLAEDDQVVVGESGPALAAGGKRGLF